MRIGLTTSGPVRQSEPSPRSLDLASLGPSRRRPIPARSHAHHQQSRSRDFFGPRHQWPGDDLAREARRTLSPLVVFTLLESKVRSTKLFFPLPHRYAPGSSLAETKYKAPAERLTWDCFRLSLFDPIKPRINRFFAHRERSFDGPFFLRGRTGTWGDLSGFFPHTIFHIGGS